MEPAFVEASAPDARAHLLDRLRALTALLEAGDDAGVEHGLAELLRERDDGLYRHLGRITRELHRAVADLKFDDQLAHLAKAEMPDAASRLDHVIEMSEKAAHRTLDLVEQSRTLASRIAESEVDLAFVHQRMQLCVRTPGACNVVANEIGLVRSSIKSCAQQLRENLSSLAQAQEYQDLSGQVIRRVITLVRSVESTLIALLQATGSNLNGVTPAAPQGLAGPVIAGINTGATQQDADALLAELGF
ncbi:MAG TPA: protein phosphatase CheZ [Nevskiaceae bacterium]|nr:protein phosphatase CheZ [Nevskiaceae bacterium]